LRSAKALPHAPAYIVLFSDFFAFSSNFHIQAHWKRVAAGGGGELGIDWGPAVPSRSGRFLPVLVKVYKILKKILDFLKSFTYIICV
jgi:hypothetical protein